MATRLRFWPLALCITLLHVRSTSTKIVEGTLSTKQVQYETAKTLQMSGTQFEQM